MSSVWEEVKDDEREKVKDFKKFKGKMMERYLIEGIKKILNPKLDKYGYGYEIDDEEEFEEESEEEIKSVDEDISTLFKEDDEKCGGCGH